jgi:hypothetical protein
MGKNKENIVNFKTIFITAPVIVVNKAVFS